MAGTITETLIIPGNQDKLNPTKKEILLSWVADVSAATVPSLLIDTQDGWYLTGADTNPGVTAPSANYGITLVNSDGIDLAGGALSALSATVSESASFSARIPSGGFTVTFANVGVNSALGTCKLFLTK
jgi:hypothetical protein